MIKDKIVNYERYSNLSLNMQIALKWLSEQNLSKLQCGRHKIKEDVIYANVQKYETKKDALYEAHKKYIDIQCVVDGFEYVGIQSLQKCHEKIAYDKNNDITFYDTNEADNYVPLIKGEMLILFPEDAHKPSINKDTTKVKKLVIKVAID